MYSMSNTFTELANARARHILTQATFNNTTTLTGDSIIDISMTESVSPSGGITMGATISSKLSMTIKMPDTAIELNQGYVKPWVGFNGVDTYCPLGKFYITNAKSKDDFKKIVTITAYDAFSKTEIPYTPQITMPATSDAILADIASQCGFQLDSGCNFRVLVPNTSTAQKFELYDFTCRQYIGYFAGLLGENARFNRDGKLTFKWYTGSQQQIAQDSQYLGGFKRLTANPVSFQSITSGTSDNVIVSGTGTSFNFENPFMTQEILNSIRQSVGTISYVPCTCKWRGNPAIEAGDIITIYDSENNPVTVYIMEQTIKISGGMQSEIKCYGQSEAAINFETSPYAKRLQQTVTQLQQAIADATKLLNAANGGIFEIIDENQDGVNDGWIIHSADKTRFIKATLDGIGITQDGGATYTQAITSQGINADSINTGTLNAQRIGVGDTTLGDVFNVDTDSDGHIVVNIGKAGSDISQKQTNDAVAFVNSNGVEVAKFSVTGAAWNDMQEMKYCGFVWTKSTITGNTRFTKAGS